jgi:hypothetical protein
MLTPQTLNDLERKGKRIKGRWKLDDRHRLTYESEDSKLEGKRTEEYELETSLVAAESEALVVSVTQKQENGNVVTSLARLTGTWRANEKNELEFEVERQSGKNDALTFTGSWKVGKNHEIIYGYRVRSGKKSSKLQTLTFKGYWDLTEKSRLTYLIEGDTESAFRFRGTFQTPGILAKEGELRYQLGVEVEGKLRTTAKSRAGSRKTITLFGKWKLSTTLELSFEIEYAGGEKREIRFGAEYALTKDLRVAAKLIDKSGDPLGIEVILTKDFLKTHAQAFVRLRKTLRESAVEAGVSIPW